MPHLKKSENLSAKFGEFIGEFRRIKSLVSRYENAPVESHGRKINRENLKNRHFFGELLEVIFGHLLEEPGHYLL